MVMVNSYELDKPISVKESNLSDFKIIEKEDGSKTITGIVENCSKGMWVKFHISLNCYDSDGCLIQNANASINNFNTGEKWRVIIDDINKAVVRIALTGING